MLLLPDGLGSQSSEREIELGASDCVAQDFWADTNGRLTGKVVDAGGRPALGVSITLSPLEDRSLQAIWATTNKDGEYELRPVPTGRYQLYARQDGLTEGEYPFPDFYYPGVRDYKRATPITIGEAQKLQGYNFKLPPQPVRRVIEGVVLWPDGHPVADANVSYDVTEDTATSSANHLAADAQGHFIIQGYENMQYVIRADTNAEIGGRVLLTEDVLVPAHKPLKLLTLVVK